MIARQAGKRIRDIVNPAGNRARRALAVARCHARPWSFRAAAARATLQVGVASKLVGAGRARQKFGIRVVVVKVGSIGGAGVAAGAREVRG